MRTKAITTVSVAAVLGLSAWAAPALAAHHGVIHNAKISMSQARKTALHTFPSGKIVHAELEHEGGGSGLRYSFDMRHGHHWREVGVDAMTGKVLENSREGANPKD
jgi:uncharacterized membrane protein YkoI